MSNGLDPVDAEMAEAIRNSSLGASEIVDAIRAAGYRKEVSVSPGLYRNKLGVEIEILSLDIRSGIIGGVWTARQANSAYPTTLAVTADGLRDSGYEKVPCRACQGTLREGEVAYCSPCVLEMEEDDE